MVYIWGMVILLVAVLIINVLITAYAIRYRGYAIFRKRLRQSTGKKSIERLAHSLKLLKEVEQ
jgi:uncharacterized membrane protein